MTKKRIILTSAIGTVALGTLAVSLTLAWYGASNLLSINTFDITIEGNTTLKISTGRDINTFKEELTARELKEDFLFEPVSSMKKEAWMNEKRIMPVFYNYDGQEILTQYDAFSLSDKIGINQDIAAFIFDNDNRLLTTGQLHDIVKADNYSEILENRFPNLTKEDAEKIIRKINDLYNNDYSSRFGFFSKRIYLLSSLSYYVSLDVDEGKSYFNNDSDSNFARAQTIYADMRKENPDTTVTINEIQNSLDNLKNCIRMSILVNVEGNYKYYIIDPYKDTSDPVKYGGMLDIDGDGYFDTYDDAGKERTRVFGEMNDESLIVYNNPIRSTLLESIDPKPFDQFYGNCFEGIQKSTAYTYNETASFNNGLEIKEEESISFEDLRANDSLIKIPCYQNVVTEIVISVYLEGWDHQCINSTMGANFDSKISFKLNGGIV